MAPKVSVCIPAYNRRAMFRATLWSVLNQSFRDMEIVVSDNVSQDDLKAEIDAANDPRVRYIRREKNLGGAENFAFLQSFPKGEYVLFLCSDDLLLPDCIEKVVAVLDANQDRGGLVYMAAHYSDDGFQYLSTMPDYSNATAEEYVADSAVRDFRFTSPSLCIFRRVVFEKLGGWNKELKAVIDWEMYSRVVRYGQGMLFLHNILAVIRLHDDRDSNTAALHWGFYHDVMLLSKRPEYAVTASRHALLVFEQLLWDFRLRQPPWRTLKHAYDAEALPRALLYLPWEVWRRTVLKLRVAFGVGTPANAGLSVQSDPLSSFDRARLDNFWCASQAVRYRD